MKKRILFTTIFSSNTIKATINKLSNIDEVIYLVEEGLEKEKSEDAKIKLKAIEDLKSSFKDVIKITGLRTSLYDIPKIMADVAKKIDQFSKDETEIFIHISEGRKPLALGLLFASYLRNERISGAFYLIKEKNELMTLPLLDFSINKRKRAILNKINQGIEDKDKIQKELKLSRSAVYQYIDELKKEGFITNETGLKITELGRVMIL